MSRQDPQVNFRLPVELRDKLQAAAESNDRTLTAELVARLKASFVGEGSSAYRAVAEYRLGLLRVKAKLTADEKTELAYILSTWKELQS